LVESVLVARGAILQEKKQKKISREEQKTLKENWIIYLLLHPDRLSLSIIKIV